MSELPGNAYAVGFLRTYAQALGLDPDEVGRRFRAEAAEGNRKTELTSPPRCPSAACRPARSCWSARSLRSRAYIGWYSISGSSHRGGDRPAVPDRLAAWQAGRDHRPDAAGA